MEHSQIVQNAVQRLRDKINIRETNFDLDAIKAVLIEMATQKERADRLEAELVEVRADRSHQRSLAESRYTDWRQQLDKTEEMKRCFENEKATSAHLEELVEAERAEKNALMADLRKCEQQLIAATKVE